ncbi:DUF3325 family protein [Duganella radicis]|uniref:DUF3325 family protein n=1 Tax=Duganella radicis TaxID=551988 RepID=A0A6L6PDU4_9BURK|nr:DUF3325 domain-containing protein [Duganella radicis]MTV36751.1 DUF3325 family protein [Duganella radicis]
MLLLAATATYAGFACLSLAMPDNWERAGGDIASHTPRRRPLRLGGALLLSLALTLCLWRDGPSFGVLLWAVLLSAGAITVAFTLTWRPSLLRGRLLTGTPPR